MTKIEAADWIHQNCFEQHKFHYHHAHEMGSDADYFISDCDKLKDRRYTNDLGQNCVESGGFIDESETCTCGADEANTKLKQSLEILTNSSQMPKFTLTPKDGQDIEVEAEKVVPTDGGSVSFLDEFNAPIAIYSSFEKVVRH